MRAAAYVFAPAKLTLSLRITGVRSGGTHHGFHEIDAEMTALDFGDRLDIVPDGSGVELTDPAGRPLRGAEAVSASDNLVTHALRLAGRRARVTVRKRIPAGAGLGGGSADAAAVLRWAGLSGADAARAATVSADVAFCLVGGRARVRGIGELVEPLPYRREVYTLLIPPVACSTPEVYAAWDLLGGPVGSNGNDLEPAALRVCPELARWRDELGDATGRRPRLAGSGSSWFVPGAFAGCGRVVAATRPAHDPANSHDSPDSDLPEEM